MNSKILCLFLLILSSCATQNKVVIAHRGASGYLPEHSFEGIAMAHSWGVDYIEADLVVTKDDELIVLHDITLDTTTDVRAVFPNRKRNDGKYYAVDFTLAEIKKLHLNERINRKTGKRVFKDRFPLQKTSSKVPTFIEFIKIIQGLNKSSKKDIGIYPELKKPEFHLNEGKDIAVLTMNILKKYGYNSKDANIYVQCFHPPTLKRLKTDLGAKMKLVALLAENSWGESSIDYDYYQTENGIKELSRFVDGIGPYYKQLFIRPNDEVEIIESKLVKFAHKYNLVVHPYTHRTDLLGKHFIDDEAFFHFLYKRAKADGVFSDFGDRALRYSRDEL